MTEMSVTREELRFDFKGAAFDLAREADRRLLGWILNQFLYGEVTGIQCGYWLYRAPHLQAASFLAKQAGEELSHVKRILRLLSILGEAPRPAHPVIRFLATGQMGHCWGEHVAMEMALGEGLVLGVFYALEDLVPDPEMKRIIASAAVDEERHVEFGERETRRWLVERPDSREFLLTQAWVQSVALGWLRTSVVRRLAREVGESHDVTRAFDAFYRHTLRCFDARVARLGLADVPLGELSRIMRAKLLLLFPFRKLYWRFKGSSPLLTASYLDDPVVTGEAPRLPGE